MEREAFPIKPKRQCHLSQRGEWVCDPQSRKKMRLLCKSVFVQIDKQNLTIKNDGKKVFLIKPKH